ncbi:MAG: Mitochondrial intermediate peptidase [Vezdaea aestivalis]|nr:MAG: Mitochondrial intermediate peptidase [Vezdaea aestivalis]
MSKILSRSPWTCVRCLCRQNISSTRRLSFATPSAPTPNAFESVQLVSHTAPSAKTDDHVLRDVFDNKAFWQDFSKSWSWAPEGGRGLLCNRFLTHPRGFDDFADRTITRCRPLIKKIVDAKDLHQYRAVVKDFDHLSDLLCRCLDLADFVRSTHPSSEIRESASRAYGKVFQYMNVLNTTSQLNTQLRHAVTDPNISKALSEEEKKVAEILLRDFSKSAIHLGDTMKNDWVQKSDEVVHWGTEFTNNATPALPHFISPSSRLKGMDPQAVRRMTYFGVTKVPVDGFTSSLVLSTVQNEGVRRKMYVESRTTDKRQIESLENMLRARADVARIAGFKSYAHMTLADKMAGSPGAVNEFLQTLHSRIRPGVDIELKQLAVMKERTHPGTSLNVWDRDYYSRMLASQQRSKTKQPDFLKAFFSIGTVMQGLSRMFSRLYGIRFVPRQLSPGETWNGDVRRLDVIHEQDGLVAVLYCDLFEREGKHSGPSHYTLRCSRHISEEEIASTDISGFASKEEAANDGMVSGRNRKGELFQLPMIALICDFQQESRTNATLLSFGEVTTLFHEMGHAVHSILGRTYLHNVSGTRCVTDFAELPSILMENFASSPEALALFARHYETDAPLPFEMIEARVRRDKMFEKSQVETQILLSLVDQAYHSILAMLGDFDSTKLFHEIFDDYSSLKEPEETTFQGLFQHLHGYGATYYSYLFDKAIADKIWRDVFAKSPGSAIDREAGDQFRREVLQWGGARDPWKCLAGILEQPALAEGGREAMREVGRWGGGTVN